MHIKGSTTMQNSTFSDLETSSGNFDKSCGNTITVNQSSNTVASDIIVNGKKINKENKILIINDSSFDTITINSKNKKPPIVEIMRKTNINKIEFLNRAGIIRYIGDKSNIHIFSIINEAKEESAHEYSNSKISYFYIRSYAQ